MANETEKALVLSAGIAVVAGGIWWWTNRNGGGGDWLSRPQGTAIGGNGVTSSITVANIENVELSYQVKLQILRDSGVPIAIKETYGALLPGRSTAINIEFDFPLLSPIFPGSTYIFAWELQRRPSGNILDTVQLNVPSLSQNNKIMRVTGAARRARVTAGG